MKDRIKVTTILGKQARHAVEVLVQRLDKADAERHGELLRDVTPSELYEAGLTVMMRLVFILCAEQRGLLYADNPVYDERYAVSTLRDQLAKEADRHGPERLDCRHDAWARLLSTFRAVYGGIDHETLHMPALGGSLFNPDRFPFLEGRPRGTPGGDFGALPLPIDNRTVHFVLSSLQVLKQPGKAQPLSYRLLEVEQIGYVYEGLLEHSLVRVPCVTVGLVGSGKARDPNLALSELEAARTQGKNTLMALLLEKTRRAESAVRNALAQPVAEAFYRRLLSVCSGKLALAERIRPYLRLLRTDPWGNPIVYRKNAFMVTPGANRRESGAHYTPQSLTESVVKATLERLVYVEPAADKSLGERRLKSSAELLDLKICDPAMGSGAFLLQACRWLAERLVEAWAAEEAAGRVVTIAGDLGGDAGDAVPLPKALEERLLVAKRLIIERCLYGVDINPLAVELAKLSSWLLTLAKGRSFAFLDRNLRQGDSLLGIHRLDQLTTLRLDPDDGHCLHPIAGRNVTAAFTEAVKVRKKLRALPVCHSRDVEAMARLDREASAKLEAVRLIADAMTDEAPPSRGNPHSPASAREPFALQAGNSLKGDKEAAAAVAKESREESAMDLPGGKPPRKPFHWPLEFPEIFLGKQPGFTAVIGNPPWGRAFTPAESEYLKRQFPHSSYKLINSFKFFIERAAQITNEETGVFALVVPSSLLEHIGCKDSRAFLLKKTPYLLVDCGDGRFKGVTQTCCYAVVGQKPAAGDHEMTVVMLSRPSSGSAATTSSTVKHVSTLTVADALSRKNYVFSVGLGSALKKQGFLNLRAVADVFDSGIDYSRVKLGKAVFYAADVPENTKDYKVLRGRNIGRYSLRFTGVWLRHNWEEIQEAERKGDAKSRLKVNQKVYLISPKILIRQTGDRLIATVDEEKYYHQKSLLCICPRKDMSVYYLCALLNHPQMTRIYRQMTMQQGKVFSQVKKNFLEQLPVPPCVDDSVKHEVDQLCKALISSSTEGDWRPKAIERMEQLLQELFQESTGSR